MSDCLRVQQSSVITLRSDCSPHGRDVIAQVSFGSSYLVCSMHVQIATLRILFRVFYTFPSVICVFQAVHRQYIDKTYNTIHTIYTYNTYINQLVCLDIFLQDFFLWSVSNISKYFSLEPIFKLKLCQVGRRGCNSLICFDL